ncbi:hypothetical protein BGZ83_009274 [Gryganskiella cystojenkinii]|nr:hypothetical protein BGZ83_009274 [Gryganskiella cystojenkinii]
MSGNSMDVYSRISEKMRNERFTEEEIKTVERAKTQLSSYATSGSLLGGAGGVLLARAKNLKGIPSMGVAMGGLLIGSQLGLVMGAMASVRTIQSIPNFKRVMSIVQEVRDETARPGGVAHRQDHASTMPSAGHQRFPVQDHGQYPPQLPSSQSYAQQRRQGTTELLSDELVLQQFQHDSDGYHGGQDPNSAVKRGQGSSSAWANAEQKAKEIQNSSHHWNEVRQKNMPRSAWNEVRDGRSPRDKSSNVETEEDAEEEHQDGLGKKATKKPLPTVAGWDRVRQHSDVDGFGSSGVDGPSAFPRTREDLESRPSRQRNQYGDSI